MTDHIRAGGAHMLQFVVVSFGGAGHFQLIGIYKEHRNCRDQLKYNISAAWAVDRDFRNIWIFIFFSDFPDFRFFEIFWISDFSGMVQKSSQSDPKVIPN